MRSLLPALSAIRSVTKSWRMTLSDVFTNSTRSENPDVANSACRRPISKKEASTYSASWMTMDALTQGGEALVVRHCPPRRGRSTAASSAIRGGLGRFGSGRMNV